MSENFDIKKYKQDSEIEIRIKLDQYIFLPSDIIKGKIEIIPKKKDIKINKKEIKIIYKLTQFQKYEYNNETPQPKIDIIIEKTFFYSCSDILNNEILEIDLDKLDLDLPADEQNNFYPTFEFRKKDYWLFIRHLLTIEIPEIKASNSTGIIICKLPEKLENFVKKKYIGKKNIFQRSYNDLISLNYIYNYGKLVYDINIKKLQYSLNEEIPIKLDINCNELNNLEINKIEFILEKKLKIKNINLNIIKFWKEKDEEKKIIMYSKDYTINKDLKNKTLNFFEKIEIDKNELPEFIKDVKGEISQKEIEKYIKFDENFLERDENRVELNPSINTDLFLCQYRIKVKIHFNSKCVRDKEEKIIINLFTLKPPLIKKYQESFFQFKENPYFDLQLNEKSSDDIEKEKEIQVSGFENIEKIDYILTLKEKDNNLVKKNIK